MNAEERELIKLMGKLKRNDIGQSHWAHTITYSPKSNAESRNALIVGAFILLDSVL